MKRPIPIACTLPGEDMGDRLGHGAATLDVAAPPDGREVLLALFAS